MRTENDIEMRKRFGEFLPITLADASSNCNDSLRKRRIASKRDVLHGSDLPIEAGVGSFANAAGHKNDNIGILDGVYHQGTECFKHTGDALRVVLVHLASKGMDAESEPING